MYINRYKNDCNIIEAYNVNFPYQYVIVSLKLLQNIHVYLWELYMHSAEAWWSEIDLPSI